MRNQVLDDGACPVVVDAFLVVHARVEAAGADGGDHEGRHPHGAAYVHVVQHLAGLRGGVALRRTKAQSNDEIFKYFIKS